MDVILSDRSVKQERFNARLSEDQKAILQRAADLKGVSLSDFVLGCAHDEALRIIEAHDMIRLSRRDSISFLTALENPPAASADMIDRFKKVKKHRAS